MKTCDELPEQFTHADLRAANEKHWNQAGGSHFQNGIPLTPPAPAPLTSKSANAKSPSPECQPGGEKISPAELASYSVTRLDRNYFSAGMAEMPAPFNPFAKMLLPRPVPANSWQEGGGE